MIRLGSSQSGKKDKEIADGERADEVATPYRRPVEGDVADGATALHIQRHEHGVVAGEQLGAQHDDKDKAYRERGAAEKALQRRIGRRRLGKAIARDKRKHSAEGYICSGKDTQHYEFRKIRARERHFFLTGGKCPV